MDRAAIVACPIMVMDVVILCGDCPPEHPKKRPPMSQLGSDSVIQRCPRHVRFSSDSDQTADVTAFLFDDLVSELLEMRRHVEAKRICCL
jgi:hypothetical protein